MGIPHDARKHRKQQRQGGPRRRPGQHRKSQPPFGFRSAAGAPSTPTGWPNRTNAPPSGRHHDRLGAGGAGDRRGRHRYGVRPDPGQPGAQPWRAGQRQRILATTSAGRPLRSASAAGFPRTARATRVACSARAASVAGTASAPPGAARPGACTLPADGSAATAAWRTTPTVAAAWRASCAVGCAHARGSLGAASPATAGAVGTASPAATTGALGPATTTGVARGMTPIPEQAITGGPRTQSLYLQCC
jgi:hypothetical protein